MLAAAPRTTPHSLVLRIACMRTGPTFMVAPPLLEKVACHSMSCRSRLANGQGWWTMMVLIAAVRFTDLFADSQCTNGGQDTREIASTKPVAVTSLTRGCEDIIDAQPAMGTVQQLANGDLLQPLRADRWYYEKLRGQSISDYYLLWSITDPEDYLLSITDPEAWCSKMSDDASKGPALVNPKKEAESASCKDGRLVVDLGTIAERPSFLSYIAGGTRISFTMAIDYTTSSGSPAERRSLHSFLPAVVLDDFPRAMSGIGRGLQLYDTHKTFPLIGFDGKLGRALPSSHWDAQYILLLGMTNRVFDSEETADYMSGCIGQMEGQGCDIYFKDFLASGSIRSKLEALSSAFNVPGGLSYCIGGAKRWLEQLFSLVTALLLPPNGKHGSFNGLLAWLMCAIVTVSAGHVTHQDAATSGQVTGSYCHHKWGCLEITLGVTAGVVALCGVCCRSSLRACAQRVRARRGASATSDNGAVLPYTRTSGTDDMPRRGFFFSCMIFWWTGDLR